MDLVCACLISRVMSAWHCTQKPNLLKAPACLCSHYRHLTRCQLPTLPNFLLRISCLCLLLLLSACATRPVVEYSVNARHHQRQLAQLQQWQVSGKLAFKSSEERFSANLHWQQRQDEYNIGLNSFIGTRLLSMQKQGGRVHLEYEDREYWHDNAAQLLEQMTGWVIPVSDLPLWIKGQASEEAMPAFADSGLIRRLTTDDGWQVSFSDYRQQDGYILPHALELSATDVQIRIRIDQWQLK